MRLPAAALLAAVLTVAIAGCSSEPAVRVPAAPATATPATSSDAADLVGATWTVREARNAETDDETVRFDGRSVTLMTPGGTSTFGWDGQGADVLITRSTLAMAGGGGTTWLTDTTRVARAGEDWTLLDSTGARTATLAPNDSATPQPSASGTAIPLAPATPGPGVTGLPASAIAGRWHLAGHPTTAITFTDGRWKAAASCETGASGGAGAYRVLSGGRLLVTRTASLMFGCPIRQDEERVRAPAIAGIDRAGSFRVAGTTLTLYDRSGAVIGSLVR